MWEAIATFSDGSIVRAFAVPDGQIHIYEGDQELPSDSLHMQVNGDTSNSRFSPESLAQTLRFWCYEFRRGEELESVQIRFLRG